jgi:hypothetical protein
MRAAIKVSYGLFRALYLLILSLENEYFLMNILSAADVVR